MSYKALVRRLDGQAAVFVAFVGENEVEVRVGGGEFRTLTRAQWRALPPYDPSPSRGGQG